MSHTIDHHRPLSLLARLLRVFAATERPAWHDSRPDSIIAPSERPRQSADHPEWLGYDPEIQRLLR